MAKKTLLIYILLAILAGATLPPFFYKAVYSPIKIIVSLPEDGRRAGDFWANWPAPFVDRYNPELKNRTSMNHAKGYWGHGPIMHFITLPLTALKSIKLVSFIWLAFNYCALATAIFLLLRLFEGLPAFLKTAVVFLWLGYWPLYMAVQEDVIEIFELFLVILSLHLLYKKKDMLAGAFLGAAAMTKFLPIVFLPYLFIKGKMKALAAMLVTLAVIIIGTQVTLNWRDSHTLMLFFGHTVEEEPVMTVWRSQTIPSIIGRFFSTTDFVFQKQLYSREVIEHTIPQLESPELTRPRFAKLSSAAAVSLIILSTFFILFKRRKSLDYSLEYAILSILMILVPPYGHHYYLIFCLIGYTVALRIAFIERRHLKSALLAISYILSGYITQVTFFDIALNHCISRHTFFYFISFPAYGILLLFIILVDSYNRPKIAETVFPGKPSI